MKYIDNPISDRLRIVREDSDPIHIYELLSKHFQQTIPTLKERYKISVNSFRNLISISGNDTDIAELVMYVTDYGLKPISVQVNQVEISLSDFIYIIF